jgi:hypothetical protein
MFGPNHSRFDLGETFGVATFDVNANSFLPGYVVG